jgi:hypothetical protein
MNQSLEPQASFTLLKLTTFSVTVVHGLREEQVLDAVSASQPHAASRATLIPLRTRNPRLLHRLLLVLFVCFFFSNGLGLVSFLVPIRFSRERLCFYTSQGGQRASVIATLVAVVFATATVVVTVMCVGLLGFRGFFAFARFWLRRQLYRSIILLLYMTLALSLTKGWGNGIAFAFFFVFSYPVMDLLSVVADNEERTRLRTRVACGMAMASIGLSCVAWRIALYASQLDCDDTGTGKGGVARQMAGSALDFFFSAFIIIVAKMCLGKVRRMDVPMYDFSKQPAVHEQGIVGAVV